MARSRTRTATVRETEFETDGRARLYWNNQPEGMYRVSKDTVALDNGIEVGHPVSGADAVIVSIALQGGNVDQVTVALGLDDAEKLAKALLREREWLLHRDPFDDLFEVDVVKVA